jgi:hypothetical protein
MKSFKFLYRALLLGVVAISLFGSEVALAASPPAASGISIEMPRADGQETHG